MNSCEKFWKTESFSDIDSLKNDFQKYQQSTFDILKENKKLHKDIESNKLKLIQYEKQFEELNSDKDELKSIIKGLQKNLSDSNRIRDAYRVIQLKVLEIEKEAQNQRQEHEKKLFLWDEEIKIAVTKEKEKNAKQIQQLETKENEEVKSLNTKLSEQQNEIKMLKNKFDEALHAKNKEIVSLRIEHDAQISKLQIQLNQKNQAIGQFEMNKQQSQYLKEEHMKDKNHLLFKIRELENRLAEFDPRKSKLTPMPAFQTASKRFRNF